MDGGSGVTTYLTDDERQRRVEKSKAVRRLCDAVVVHFLEGLTAKQSSERFGLSVSTVERYRWFLQLTVARGSGQRGRGRWASR